MSDKQKRPQICSLFLESYENYLLKNRNHPKFSEEKLKFPDPLIPMISSAKIVNEG